MIIDFLKQIYSDIATTHITNAIKVGFVAGIVRVVLFKKGLVGFFSEWVLAAFVVYLASKVLPHYSNDKELIAGASAALGFLAREVLNGLLIVGKGVTPELAKKITKYLE